LTYQIYKKSSHTTSSRLQGFLSLPVYCSCHPTGKRSQVYDATSTEPMQPEKPRLAKCCSISRSSFLFGHRKYSGSNLFWIARQKRISDLITRDPITLTSSAAASAGQPNAGVFEYSIRRIRRFERTKKFYSNSIRANSNSNCHLAIRFAQIYRARIRS
jgi:hypothetical protein